MYKLVLFFTLLLLSACTSATNEQGQQNFAVGDIGNNNVTTPDTVSFREGDMTDIADINPNFLDLNTENESHNNHGAYVKKAREIVANSQLFEPDMIYVNGDKLIVNVTPVKKLSKDDLGRYRNGLHDRIMEAIPRYNIDIRVNGQ